MTWNNFSSFIRDKIGLTVEINPNDVINYFDVGPKNKLINETSIQRKKLLHKPMSSRKIVSINKIEKIYNNLRKLEYELRLNKSNKKY